MQSGIGEPGVARVRGDEGRIKLRLRALRIRSHQIPCNFHRTRGVTGHRVKPTLQPERIDVRWTLCQQRSKLVVRRRKLASLLQRCRIPNALCERKIRILRLLRRRQRSTSQSVQHDTALGALTSLLKRSRVAQLEIGVTCPLSSQLRAQLAQGHRRIFGLRDLSQGCQGNRPHHREHASSQRTLAGAPR